jgi:myo-inositol catabolism protein IolC
VILRDVAHSRAGDKGALANVSVIAFDERDFPWLVEVVTAGRVREHLGALIVGEVRRYLLPEVGAMNFVVSRPPGQSVTRTLALDAHGKSLSSALLEMPMPDRGTRADP